VKITNQTKKNTLADNAVLAANLFSRAKGLLGKKELKIGAALILKPCNSIHTFFMRFPIDVLFLDKNNLVIETKSNLKPFRFTRLYFNSALVIELPAGTISSTLTAKGDRLFLE